MLRKLTAAATVIALLTGTASAQMPMPSMSFGKDKPPPTAEEIARQKAIDNAYNSATKKIPDKKVAADPWGNIRSVPAPTAKSKQ